MWWNILIRSFASALVVLFDLIKHFTANHLHCLWVSDLARVLTRLATRVHHLCSARACLTGPPWRLNATGDSEIAAPRTIESICWIGARCPAEGTSRWPQCSLVCRSPANSLPGCTTIHRDGPNVSMCWRLPCLAGPKWHYGPWLRSSFRYSAGQL